MTLTYLPTGRRPAPERCVRRATLALAAACLAACGDDRNQTPPELGSASPVPTRSPATTPPRATEPARAAAPSLTPAATAPISPRDRIIAAHVKLLQRDTVSFEWKRVDLLTGRPRVIRGTTDQSRSITIADTADGLKLLFINEDMYLPLGTSWRHMGWNSATRELHSLARIAEWDYNIEPRGDEDLDGVVVERYRGVAEWEGFRVQGSQEFDALIRKDNGELVSIEWVDVLSHHRDGFWRRLQHLACQNSGGNIVTHDAVGKDDFLTDVLDRVEETAAYVETCEDFAGNITNEWTSIQASHSTYLINAYDEPMDVPASLPNPPTTTHGMYGTADSNSSYPPPPSWTQTAFKSPANSIDKDRLARVVENTLSQDSIGLTIEQLSGKPGFFKIQLVEVTTRLDVNLELATARLRREGHSDGIVQATQIIVDGNRYVQASDDDASWMYAGTFGFGEFVEGNFLSPLYALREMDFQVARLPDEVFDGRPAERYAALGEFWSPSGGRFWQLDILVNPANLLPFTIEYNSQELRAPPHTVAGFERLYCDRPGVSLLATWVAPPDADPRLIPPTPSQPFAAECVDDASGATLAEWRFIDETDEVFRRVLAFESFNEPVAIPDDLPAP